MPSVLLLWRLCMALTLSPGVPKLKHRFMKNVVKTSAYQSMYIQQYKLNCTKGHTIVVTIVTHKSNRKCFDYERDSSYVRDSSCDFISSVEKEKFTSQYNELLSSIQ